MFCVCWEHASCTYRTCTRELQTHITNVGQASSPNLALHNYFLCSHWLRTGANLTHSQRIITCFYRMSDEQAKTYLMLYNYNKSSQKCITHNDAPGFFRQWSSALGKKLRCWNFIATELQNTLPETSHFSVCGPYSCVTRT